MTIGILSVQGAFIEHARALAGAGARTFEIRQLRDLDRPMDGLVLPGGESTVQGKLLKDLGLFEPLRARIEAGLPVTVRRNAYGRQLGSFTTTGTWNGLADVPMTFIRAPAITQVSPGVDVLSSFEGQPTSVRWRNILAFAWHPELTADRRAYAVFLDMCARR